MPLGAMCVSTMEVGAKTLTRAPTGEFVPSYDYSASVPIAVRVYDVSLKSRQRQFGNTLEIDLRVKAPLSVSIETFIYDPGGAQRLQVRIYDARPSDNLTGLTPVLYEVLWCRTPGNVGRYKELYLKRWK